MNKKFIKIILISLLLFSMPQAMAMNWEKYIVPIGLVATGFAIFFFTKIYSCCSLKKTSEIEDYYTFWHRQPETTERYHNYARIFYKKCKMVLNSPNVCDSCRNRFLTSIKKNIPNLERYSLFNYHRRIISVVCLLGCKYDDYDLVSLFISNLAENGINDCLDAATLFKSKSMIDQLINNYSQDYKINISEQSFHEIIERKLKGSRYQYDLVANFFETMLHRAKTGDDKAVIIELLDSTLKDKIDQQLDLLFIVVKHKYKLLEKTLEELFGLTLNSKNSKNQTLYHRTYLLHPEFNYGQNPESFVSVLKRLCDEQVGGINDPDSYGKTALHYAIELCYKLWSANSNDYNRHANIKHGIKKFGLKLLLTHPSIDLTIKNRGMPLIWNFFEYSSYLIKDILARENFNPYQVHYGGINFLNKFFMKIADGYHKAGKCLNFTKLQNAKEMTQQLKLLVKTYDTSCSSSYYDIYENLATLIFLYIRCGGSITQPGEDQLAAIDIAHSMYIAYREKYNTLLHEESKTDSKENNQHPYYYKKTKVEKALISLNTKEIIYHIYLTKIPHANPQWLRTYFILRKTDIPVEIAQYISKFYFNLTIEREIDRYIAFEVKNNFDNIKREKENYYNYSHTTIRAPVEQIKEASRIECLELDYYHKNQNEKEQYRQKVLQKMLRCTSSS